MKARITTVLSLVGVLGAGSAAALVNTQVLQSTEANSNGQVTIGSSADSNGTTSVTTATGEATKIQSDVVSATQAMFQIGDAGLVTLDTSGDVLTVVSVTPSSGWTVVKAENDGTNEIEVKLQNGNTVVEFRASLQLGVITTSVESKIVGSGGIDVTVGGGTVPVVGSTPVSIDDDDSTSVTIDVEHEDDGGHGGDDD